MARCASNANVLRSRWWLGSGVGERGVTSTAKGEGFDGISVREVFVFPGTMMQRLFPFCGYFRVAISASRIRGQTNARNWFEVPSRGGAWKRYVVRAARSRSKQERADEGHADAQEIEAKTHAVQHAGRAHGLSTGNCREAIPGYEFASRRRDKIMPSPWNVDIRATSAHPQCVETRLWARRDIVRAVWPWGLHRDT